MFKLSRKGWNNVIIVVVLIVITLLHRMETAQQENSAKRARPLLPDAAVVLTWQGPSWQIERIGQGWRSVPDLGLDTAQLDARLTRWQRLVAAPRRGGARYPGDHQGVDCRPERSGRDRPLSEQRPVWCPAALRSLARPHCRAVSRSAASCPLSFFSLRGAHARIARS